jgi:hypothetical protein
VVEKVEAERPEVEEGGYEAPVLIKVSIPSRIGGVSEWRAWLRMKTVRKL